jgi:RND family efflux transporter MFP subunit
MRSSALVLLALTLPTLAACRDSRARLDEGPVGTPVEVATLATADLTRTVRYAADLRASAEVQLFTTVSDRVLAFPYEDGDFVEQGARVALIRRATLDKGIEQLAAQIEALDVQLASQARDLARSRELLEGGVITQQIFDQATSGYEANQAQRRALRASLDQLSLNAGEASVLAPVSGVLANRSVDVGDRTAPSLALGSILVMDPIEVELDLSELDARQVSVGDPVTVTVEAWPERGFEGTVTRVHPYLDPVVRTNTVELRLDNPQDEQGRYLLKPGMFGRAALVVDRRDDATVAPQQALLLDSLLLAEAAPGQDLRRAYVVDEQGIARERRVELGLREGELYEVRSGLEPGDRLVVRGQHGLRDGEPVRVVGGAS